MNKGYKIAYWLRTDMQHVAHIQQIYAALGGIILTKNEDIYNTIKTKYAHLAPEVRLVKNSTQAKILLWKLDIKIVIYTGFQMLYWGYAVQVFHGVSDKHYVEDKHILLYDLLLLPGQKHWDKLEHFGLLRRPERFKIVGYPKFDHLVRREAVVIPLFNNGRPTILYAPTWITQDSGTKCNFSPYGESSLPLWGKRLIKAIGPRWNLIIKYHSRTRDTHAYLCEELDEYIVTQGLVNNVKAVWDADITPYMHQADLMITDISAVCYEWFHLDRPVVFANPAPEHYKPSRDRFSNTYGWRAGEVLYREEDIVTVIERSLKEDNCREIRNKLLNYAFFKPDGHAAERQVQAIEMLYQSVVQMPKWELLVRSIFKAIRYFYI